MTDSASLSTRVQRLLRHEGKVVPWITRWTGEEVNAQIEVQSVGGKLRVGYKDGNESREASGILWQREGITRGGQPQFAQVSTYRQRSAMARRLCQVCGQQTVDDPIEWLVPRQLLKDKDGVTVTQSAPTCQDCMKVSLSLCPHLKRGDWVIGRVSEYEAWGVWGEGIFMQDGKLRRANNLSFRYGMRNPLIEPTAFVAKQQLVAWTKFTLDAA